MSEVVNLNKETVEAAEEFLNTESKLPKIKSIAIVVAGCCAGCLVDGILKTITPVPTSAIKKLVYRIGSLSLSGMIVSMVSDNVEKELDEAEKAIKKFKIKLEDNDDPEVIVQE